jgi:hypothetical protein
MFESENIEPINKFYGYMYIGSHFCSNCKKTGNYQCYTCPTSYCRICVKKSEFCILRQRKGLCEECLPVVSMIEQNEIVNNDGVCNFYYFQ